MDNRQLSVVEWIRSKLEARLDSMNEDGGPTSGNWGHVGNPPNRGGSAPGGGHGFMMQNTGSKGSDKKYGNWKLYSKFTSQAKIRKIQQIKLADANRKLKAVGAKGNPKKTAAAQKTVDRLNKRSAKINMQQKSYKRLEASGKYDPNASRNILNDKERGKTARESSVGKYKGTKEAITHAFPKRTTKGGDGSKGGKTPKKTAKQ